MMHEKCIENSTDIDMRLSRVVSEFEECLKNRRAVLLDVFEGIFGDSQHWEFVRKRLLKLLGDSGLWGDFLEIVEREKNRHGDHISRS